MHPLTALLSLSTLLTFALTSPLSSTTTTTTLKPYQLRGVQSPIFHLYLQPHPTNKSLPVMGPESTSEYFSINQSIQSLNSSLFLNIGPKVAGKSYLPLSFGSMGGGIRDDGTESTGWGLEGDTIITPTSSIYGRQLNFLACESGLKGYHTLYLQTGSDIPSGVSCSNYQTIHTPCLC